MTKGPFNLVVAKSPPWTRKETVGGYILRYPPKWAWGRAENLSAPQLSACLALTRAASSAYGRRGKERYKGVDMPVIAVEVARAVPKGVKVHGGLTREERATRAHENVTLTVVRLESLLSEKRARAGIPVTAVGAPR